MSIFSITMIAAAAFFIAFIVIGHKVQDKRGRSGGWGPVDSP